MLQVPRVVGNKARDVGATDWLDALPAVVDALCQQWSLELGATYPDATEAFVAAATQTDGIPVVLKLLIPRDGDAAHHEINALKLAAGEGCVRLLAHDADAGAMLLERLGEPLSALGLPLLTRQAILCDVAARMWRPLASSTFPTGADKAHWLVDSITSSWEQMDRPCSERSVAQALRCAESRAAAHDDERSVLLHGDVHQWNTLRSPDGFKLVDPDGLDAEPEYDLGILMREDPADLIGSDGRDRAHHLATLTGRDARAIWEWGVVERVSTGLLSTRVGLQPMGQQMLEVANHIATVTPGDWFD